MALADVVGHERTGKYAGVAVVELRAAPGEIEMARRMLRTNAALELELPALRAREYITGVHRFIEGEFIDAAGIRPQHAGRVVEDAGVERGMKRLK